MIYGIMLIGSTLFTFLVICAAYNEIMDFAFEPRSNQSADQIAGDLIYE